MDYKFYLPKFKKTFILTLVITIGCSLILGGFFTEGVVYGDSDVNCKKEPETNDPPGGGETSSGDPTFVQVSRRTTTSFNYEKPKLELPSGASTNVLISYQKSLITTSPEVQVASTLPSWLNISGNTNTIDLGDEDLGFVELTFDIAADIEPNSNVEVKLNLIDVGTQEVVASKTIRIFVDRTLFAQISIPIQGSLVRGNVPIFGLAYGDNFSSYTVEYGAGYEPSVWTTIVTSSTPQTNDTSPVAFTEGNLTIYGNLATWETGLAEYDYPWYPWSVDLNGIYTVRLTVEDTLGRSVSDEVVVQVGKVMGSTYSGSAVSRNGNVVLLVPEQAIKDDFEVIGIDIINPGSVEIDAGYNLIGDMYEIRPPGLEFTKPATLEMYYTDADLGEGDETKLCIYTYNPVTGHWNYLPSTIDSANNKLTTSITKLTSQCAYYAIFEKVALPAKPVLNQPSSPTQDKLITVTGTSSPNLAIELYVNSLLKGETTATSTGTFSLDNLPLTDGINTITARARDQFGQISPESEPVTVEVSEPILTVNSLNFKTTDYSADFTGTVDLGHTLYIQINATDPDPNTKDKTSISLTSSQTDPQGIVLQLEETTTASGIFRGEAQIGTNSSQSQRTIAAYQDSEIITATSLIDNTKTDTVTLNDDTPPSAPTITSSTHPSVCQNTFEDGLDEWSNRDGDVGATLSLTNAVRIDNTNALELVNLEYGGNFASNVRTTPFDASQYPLVSFDYKIPEDIKINFLVKLQDDDTWYDIIFTDTPKNYWRLNMEPIGSLEGVVKDNTWHNITFNLYEMLKTKTDNFQVKELIMADWDSAGYMKLVYGTNSAYATYYIDNFIITKRGFTNNDPQFTIQTNFDPSGIAGYSFILDQTSDTIPDTIIDSTTGSVSYTDIADGLWYFHARVQDGSGNWSPANHYKIFIDTHGPKADMPTPAPYTSSGTPLISVHLTDNQGTGVDPETIRLKVEDVEYNIYSPALTYDKETEILTFTPLELGIIWPNGHVIDVELTQAKDYLGNILQNSISWEWVLDYSLDTTPPNAPTIISPSTHNLTYNRVSFMWESKDANGIADYSFILDQEPATIPDDESEGLITSKVYNLAAGTYYFHVKAKDRAGNWSETTHYQITISEITSLLINDFNDGTDPNEVGGSSGIWNSEGASCQASYYNTDLNNVYGQTGYSLQLTYDVTQIDSYAGYWTAIYIDLTDYKALSFWIKGTAGEKGIKVGLKDSFWNETKVLIDDYLSSGITTNWQKVVIPLSAFSNITNWTSMNNISISFDYNLVSPPNGTIYIDEFRFEKTIEPIIVSTFNGATNQNSLGGSLETFTGGVAAISCGYDSDNTYNNSAYGYNITYSGIDYWSYAGWKSMLNNLDASNCNSLSFYIKGSVGGEKPNIWLGYNTKNNTYDRKFIDIERYVTITTDWKRVNIPLLDFINQGVDVSNLIELQVVFEWEDMSGTIYLDDIQFTNVDFNEAPVVDTIPDITNQENITITGKGIPGQTIIPVVEIPYCGRWEQTPVTVGEDGTFTAIVNICGQGHKQIYVYAIDEDGNITLNSATQVTLLDQTPPQVPTISEIASPRQDTNIVVSGLAETNSTVYIKLTQPNSGLIEYSTQAVSGAYSIDIDLTDGDGIYQITTVSKDNAGNLSAESTPVQVVLDAVNEPPLIVISQPEGNELIGSDTYEILWQAIDPDPTDTLTINIQYTNALNQSLVDNFDDGNWLNCLEAWSGLWNAEGATIEAIFNHDPALIYGEAGMSLQLNYNVTAQNSHAGIWTGLYTQPDMSAYDYLSFLVKGAIGQEIFEVGLKDSTYTETKLLVTNYLSNDITTEWQRVTIPLTDFTNIDITSLNNFSITFANSIGSASGTIYLDEIRFMKWQDITLDEANDGAYTWEISSLPKSDKYLLKLTATDSRDLEAQDESDDYFCLSTNLAKNKVTLASSEENPNLVPSNAVDGDSNTRWSSCFSDPQWIQIDLGQKQNINRVRLNWETAYGKAYEIQTSDDAVNWTTVYSTTTGDGEIDDISLATTSCQYLRMYGTERGTEWGYSLWEFEVYYAPPICYAVASSQESSDMAANYAIDGNFSTRWSSEFTDDEWIYVDFGAPKTFNTVILNWETAYGQSYKLQISNDAINWTTIYSTTTGDGGEDIIFVGEQTARYLKMKGIQRGTDWGYSLWEMEARYE